MPWQYSILTYIIEQTAVHAGEFFRHDILNARDVSNFKADLWIFVMLLSF